MSTVLSSRDNRRDLAHHWVRRSVTTLAAIAVLILATGMVENSYADCHGSKESYAICEGVKVTGFITYVTDSPYYVLIDSDLKALSSCTPQSGSLLRLPTHEANWREVYATLLLAKAQGSKVDIRMDPGASVCSIAYVILK
jgi:hypothetical protein